MMNLPYEAGEFLSWNCALSSVWIVRCHGGFRWSRCTAVAAAARSAVAAAASTMTHRDGGVSATRACGAVGRVAHVNPDSQADNTARLNAGSCAGRQPSAGRQPAVSQPSAGRQLAVACRTAAAQATLVFYVLPTILDFRVFFTGWAWRARVPQSRAMQILNGLFEGVTVFTFVSSV